MADETEPRVDWDGIPASLRHKTKEPMKSIQLRIPLSWSEKLSALGREYDQDVSTFLREAIEDWLWRASKIRAKGDSKE